MQIKIRELLETDYEQLKNIILKAENFGEPFVDSELERIKNFKTLPKLGRTLIAEDLNSNLIVGYICLEFKWRSLVIQSIITHHNYLKKGIGKMLVQKAIEIGENHPKINIIRVDTGDFMDYAQKFYLSCGFQICGFVSHDIS